MSELRKAAEMALEALEKLRFANAPFLDEAMEALRTALDKPEIDTQALVEIAVLAEREACAKLVEADGLARGNEGLVLIKAAGRIRARGEK